MTTAKNTDDDQAGLAIFDGQITDAVSAWAADLRAQWVLPILQGSTLDLGMAIGSGTGARESPQTRTFRQTGLHSNETGINNYSSVLEPELANLALYRVALNYPSLNYGTFSLHYTRLRSVQLADETFDSELDLEINRRSRDIGEEWGLGWNIDFDSGLELQTTVSQFTPGAAIVGPRSGNYHRAQMALTYEF